MKTQELKAKVNFHNFKTQFYKELAQSIKDQIKVFSAQKVALIDGSKSKAFQDYLGSIDIQSQVMGLSKYPKNSRAHRIGVSFSHGSVILDVSLYCNYDKDELGNSRGAYYEFKFHIGELGYYPTKPNDMQGHALPKSYYHARDYLVSDYQYTTYGKESKKYAKLQKLAEQFNELNSNCILSTNSNVHVMNY